MKNLLKKTLSILTALAILLSNMAVLAEGEGTLPTLEVGSGINGMLDPTAEIRTYAGRSGDVRFTLTLSEECGISVAWNGSGLSLTRPDQSSPVYTFTRHVEGDEYAVISMTSTGATGYTLTSEILPEEPAGEPEATQEEAVDEEPAPEETQEETVDEESVPEETQEETVDEKPVPEEAEKETVDEEPAPEETQDEVTAEEPDPVEEAAEEPGETIREEHQEETQEEQQAPEEDIESEQKEPEITAEEKHDEIQEKTEEDTQDVLQEELLKESHDESETPTVGDETETADKEDEQLTEEESFPETMETTEQSITDETELAEQTENKENEQQETVETESAADSVEIIIAKSLTPDESWNGTVRNKKPTILKLDVAQSRTIHMLVQGKDVCYSVQKSDCITEDAGQVMTDTATNRSIMSWTAEAGYYLISIKAGENSLAAKVTITFMTDEEFEAWEAEQVAREEENQQEEEIPEETEGELETDTEDDSESESERTVYITLSWDTDKPKNGDVAHFRSTMTGYEGLIYTLQWQTSWDEITWTDFIGATQPDLDVTITRDMNGLYFRLMVYLEEEQES